MIKTTTTPGISLVESLPGSAKLLDVGGASRPFVRADAMIDIVPYGQVSQTQTRGEGPLRCGPEDYVQQDICDHQPWPFREKQFDYVTCSHVLEDIRDPLWVCHEMMRVGKAGYIEIPSRLFETTFNLETRGLSGAAHHRWIIELDEAGVLQFTFKYFHIHKRCLNRNRQSLSKQHDDMLLRLEWEGDFQVNENWLGSGREIFEYYLDKKISDSEYWALVRKISPHGFVSRWFRYLKQVSPWVGRMYARYKASHHADIAEKN